MFLSGHAVLRFTEMDKKVAEMHSEMEAVVDKTVAAGGKQRILMAAKNPIAWSTSRTHLVWSLKFSPTAMSCPIQQEPIEV